jgi:hypothetical protein
VLDPFIGAGTTVLAAKRLGRQYIGIDVDEEYIKIAKEKLKEVKFMEPKGYAYQYKTGKKQSRGNDSFALNHTVRDDQFEFDTTSLKKEHRKRMTQKENQATQLILFENYREYSVGE